MIRRDSTTIEYEIYADGVGTGNVLGKTVHQGSGIYWTSGSEEEAKRLAWVLAGNEYLAAPVVHRKTIVTSWEEVEYGRDSWSG